MSRLKLNVLLGSVKHLESSFKAAIKDYITFFGKSQGAFRGIRKTYSPRPDTIDIPGERDSKAIQTTVKEKLDWFVESNSTYIDGLFAAEATNASGLAVAQLEVDDMIIGTYSSLELLRLISILESEGLESMYSGIPVRSDSENWDASDDSGFGYDKRNGIFETTKQVGVKKSMTKEQYILKDPNIDPSNPNAAKYTPVTAVKETILELGDWTVQHFSGEETHRNRADILRRRTRLIVAAKEALKKANEVEVQGSDMTAKKLFAYLHTGKIE
jgi:hypothetical protein